MLNRAGLHLPIDHNDLPISDSVAGMQLVVEDRDGSTEGMVCFPIRKGTGRIQARTVVDSVGHDGAELPLGPRFGVSVKLLEAHLPCRFNVRPFPG